MAKACGLRIGPRGYELVLLDGSAKKHKVVASEAGELTLSDPDGAVDVLKDLAKRHDIPKDGLRVVVEGGLAAFRKLSLPVNDDDKIEKVVKFEVESELPQFNIDDVIVDWERLSSTKDSCSLLTTIVRKEDLQVVLDVCERGGVEPIEVDADTSAIVNAAAAANAFDPASACLLVFIGEDSSSLAILDGGELRELRSIKQGAKTHIAPAAVVAEEDSSELGEEGDVEAEFDDEEEEFLEEHADATGSAADRDQVLARMRREIARSISGARTLQPLERVLVAGYDMPGLIGADIMEVPVEELGGLPDTAACSSRCAAAYGAAVGQLGGGLMSQRLRREELRFTGTMERLELPLAVAGLLLLTFLGVWNIGLDKEHQKINRAVTYWRDAAVSFMVPASMEDAGNLSPPPKWMVDYARNFTQRTADGEFRTDPARTSYEQMTYLRGRLRQEVLSLERELGQGGDFEQPQSALKGVSYVLDVLDNTRGEGARPSIRSLKSMYNRGNSTMPDNVTVILDVTFFAEDTATGTEHFEAFRGAIEEQPWHLDFNPAKTDPLENGEGIIVERITIKVDVSKTEEATS
jgi:hypothetical protein